MNGKKTGFEVSILSPALRVLTAGRIRTFALVLIACMAFASAADTAKGDTLQVPGDYATIQAAIDAANTGDVVLVADGTYTGSGNKNLNFNGKAVHVRSAGGPSACVIDCQNSGWGFYINSGEGSSSIVEGFTITKGSNTGGGIYCVDSSPSVINCIIIENSSGIGTAGGVYCAVSNPTFTNCIIAHNSTNIYGGGIYCDRSSPTLTNCLITGNTAALGGGIYCVSGSSPTLTNCTIADNISGTYGGGICCQSDSDPVLNNTIVWGNTATTGADQIYTDDANSCVMLYNSCCPDTPSDLSGTAPIATYDAESITDDPLFEDPASDDYHLQDTSPCIDTGDNSLVPPGITEDLDGINRIVDGDNDSTATVDMGPYEYQHVVYVKTDGDDTNNGFSWDTAVQTIQKGLDLAGDTSWTVLVANGTYAGAGNKDLNFNGKAVVLKSQNGAGSCTIDCEGSGRGLAFFNGETSDAVVDGFTITNGANDAGLIYINGASPTIQNCIIRSNDCTFMTGGGLYLASSNSHIINCIIANNYGSAASPSPKGGGLYVSGGSPTVTNCTIVNNRAHQGSGGGIYCTGSATVTVNNSILWGNISGWLTGVPDQVYVSSGSVTLNYCDVGAGRTGSVTENDCIYLDPEFVDPGSTGTGNYGDYHLLGTSPCIDGGDDSYVPADVVEDLDGRTRIMGAAVDIGVYEATFSPVAPVVSVTTPSSPSGSPVTITYELSDDNGDECTVSFDFSIDSGTTWTSCTAYTGDSNPQLNVTPGTGHTFLWDADADLAAPVTVVMVRVTADDGGNGGSGEDTTGEFAVDTSITPNTPPVVSVTTPASPSSSPVIITYDLTDDDGDNCTVTFEYSTDGGTTWYMCIAAGGDSNPQTNVAPANGLTFDWDAQADLPDQLVNVVVRVTADDGNGGSGEDTTGEFALDTTVANTPPVVSITTPASPSSGAIAITYTLTDAQSDTCGITVEYSTDGGGTWNPCGQGAGGDGVSGLDSSAAGTTHIFVWASSNDGVGTAAPEVVQIQITPHDGKDAGSPAASGDFTVDNTTIVGPVANFSATPTSGDAALTVSFTDQSTGVYSSWYWDFGDGYTSTEQNPTHIYRLVGTYDVTLTVDGAEGDNSLTKIGYITVTDPGTISADFTASPVMGEAPLDVQFTDLSVGDVRSWSWDFGDGHTSIQQSPTHTYTSNGVYTVTLTVSGPAGDDTEIKASYINVSAGSPAVAPKKKSGGCSCTVDAGPAPFADLLGYFAPLILLACAYLALRRRPGAA